jgi:predicted nucleic acid-binding protein
MLLCDTGPLVAAGLSRDPDHHACVDLFTGMHLAGRPMLVPAPVVAEVGYLLHARGSTRAESTFLRSVAAGDFRRPDHRRLHADGRPRRHLRRPPAGRH